MYVTRYTLRNEDDILVEYASENQPQVPRNKDVVIFDDKGYVVVGRAWIVDKNIVEIYLDRIDETSR